MKNLKRVTVLLFIAAFTVSCGQDNQSGSSTKSIFGNIQTNPSFISSANSGASQQAYQSLVSWFQSNQEGQLYQTHLEQTLSSSNQNNNQNCNSWLGGFIQFCGSASMGTSSVTSSQRTCFAGQGLNPTMKTTTSPSDYYCQNSSGSTTYSKSNNVELSKLMSMNNGTWSIYQATSSGSKVTIYVGPQLNNTANSGNYYSQPTPTAMYVIDTSVHSAHNPIESHDLSTGVVKVKQ